MQKTKLGVSVGVLGAAIFFSGLFSGYVITIILVGYVLLMEENIWLKKAGVKAIALMMGFSILSALIGLIPDVIGVINGFCTMFGGYFTVDFITGLQGALSYILGLIETILLLMLGFKAFTMGTVTLPIIDRLVNKEIMGRYQ